MNAITQENYGTDKRHVDYEGLYRCFSQILFLAKSYELSDVHFPLIGCSLAGRGWDVGIRLEMQSD